VGPPSPVFALARSNTGRASPRDYSLSALHCQCHIIQNPARLMVNGLVLPMQHIVGMSSLGPGSSPQPSHDYSRLFVLEILLREFPALG